MVIDGAGGMEFDPEDLPPAKPPIELVPEPEPDTGDEEYQDEDPVLA